MDPVEILRGHHISNFGKENTRDNRLIRTVPDESTDALAIISIETQIIISNKNLKVFIKFSF